MLPILALLACATPAPPPAPAIEAPAPSPAAQLDALDGRQPVPMPPHMAAHQKEQMRGHLVAVQAVTAALQTDDWAAMEAAAARLGTSPEMSGMCEHMGAAADGFTEQALDFHSRADAIGAAARAHDRPAALGALAHTLEACTGCHARWRQQVVTEAEYARLSE